MDRARQLLASRRCSVLEAANAVGYTNPSHFARAFRGVLASTPNLSSPYAPDEPRC